ncbi:hypothetical protein QT381_03185 [Galbitalea sp. SE-J8]|uniref:hypothetical protein n=1 Tax=Galbitalea sp. SE-J8 TaxID=3054952 RepID=UPI00259CA2AA|nr:hypothetical protein [Galbitalea sp. SE-J8]MDM4762007.1 hypothetical protein [Galbitalea sp. SE-J8]
MTESERADAAAAPGGQRRGGRRVTTAPPPGSDPHPVAEPERHAPAENDARLRGDVPPHWGKTH